MWTVQTRIGWTLVLIGAALLVLLSLRYFTFDPEVYFPRQRDVYEAKTLGLMVHISGMVVPALLGPFQFLRSFRNRHLALHRWTGRLYIAGAMVGGLGGLYMAQYSASGWISDIGFALLALALLGCTAMAYVQIRSGNVQLHREWMTRSYALIFAAVTLRIYAPFLEAALGEQGGYALVAWVCWLPNLAVAEWLIRGHLRGRVEPRRVAA
jgi:uncharacterized membrane protein